VIAPERISGLSSHSRMIWSTTDAREEVADVGDLGALAVTLKETLLVAFIVGTQTRPAHSEWFCAHKTTRRSRQELKASGYSSKAPSFKLQLAQSKTPYTPTT
jgi:hypothetical protein